MLLKNHVHLGLRLRHARARTQATHHTKPRRGFPTQARIIHNADRPPEVRPGANLEAGKTGRRNPDDDEWRVVNCDLPPNDARIKAEPALPEFVADDCRRLRACRLIIRLGKHTPHYGAHSKRREEIAGDLLLLSRFNRAAPARLVNHQPGAFHAASADDAVEGLITVAKYLVDRIAE